MDSANTSYCRDQVLEAYDIVDNLVNNITEYQPAFKYNPFVYNSMMILEVQYPLSFHCYYAGKESYVTIMSYIEVQSWEEILINILNGTAEMIDAMRLMYAYLWF